MHPWGEDSACLACLYLPNGTPREDRVIGSALGLSSDLELLQVRRLCTLIRHCHRRCTSRSARSSAFTLTTWRDSPTDRSGRCTSRACAGMILPLSRIGGPTQEVHVPIAHQSALAGVLLGGRLAARAIGRSPDMTSVSRIDVIRPLGEYLTQPRQKDSRGICICQDKVYQDAYRAKYDHARPRVIGRPSRRRATWTGPPEPRK